MAEKKSAKKIKVVVNPTLSNRNKIATYKGKVYSGTEAFELPEECLMWRTNHFGSIVPSFVRYEEVPSKDDDGTVIE